MLNHNDSVSVSPAQELAAGIINAVSIPGFFEAANYKRITEQSRWRDGIEGALRADAQMQQ